jgi:hypothetical protein
MGPPLWTGEIVPPVLPAEGVHPFVEILPPPMASEVEKKDSKLPAQYVALTQKWFCGSAADFSAFRVASHFCETVVLVTSRFCRRPSAIGI